MDLSWNPITIPAWISCAFTLASAWVVYMAKPRSRANRFLALALACDALASALNYGFLYSVARSEDAYAVQIAGFVAFGLALAFYLLFLGTLDTPITRRLRHPGGIATMGAIGLALAAAPLVADRWVFSGLYHPSYAVWEAESGPGYYAISVTALAIALLGLIAAITAFRRARGAASRAKARAYVIAFSIHDVTLASVVIGWVIISRMDPAQADALSRALIVFYPVLGILFVGALAYGMLRTQLFDLDLKVKWTIRRGTVVAVFAGVFVIAAQIASNYLQGAFGWLAGGAVAGALLLVVRPIERAADRVADRALPRVKDTPEYRTVKKREVYRAAIDGALEDGLITDKERRVLATLADQLGLGVKESLDIEREARGALA